MKYDRDPLVEDGFEAIFKVTDQLDALKFMFRNDMALCLYQIHEISRAAVRDHELIEEGIEVDGGPAMRLDVAHKINDIIGSLSDLCE